MQKGTNWAGDYSRFSFDEAQRYFMLLKEQGKPVLDDDFNLSQEVQLTLLRRFIFDSFGDGASGEGFKIVGTGAENDFTIKGGDGTLAGAGRAYVAGYLTLLESDTTYSGQQIPGTALTTPAAERTDEVYLDIYLDEVGPADDPSMNDPTLGVETGRRLKLFWQVLVAEGSVTPQPFTDANNRPHWPYQLATINRVAQAGIDADMVVDERNVFGERYARLNGGPDQRFSVAAATAADEAVNQGQANTDYARLDSENTFAQIQHAPKFDSASARYLKEILEKPTPSVEELARIGLYHFRWLSSGQEDIGAIADEAASVLPNVASYDTDGDPAGLDYGRTGFIIARALLDRVLEQGQEIASLRKFLIG